MSPHAELFHTLVSLMSDEQILRFQKRITLLTHDSAQGYNLFEALSTELIRRELVEFKVGLGPDPGKYKGPVIDFEKAAEELEEPKWTSRSEDLCEEIQREREAQGLPRRPHPLAEDYE
jgi:hypothetical protein